MAESGESPRLSDELGPVDYLMHRGEANPRTRSGIMALELLDGTPDWDRFRTRFENASRRVLRLRQKVVVPTLPTAAPRWVVDPDFNLDFHVRRVRVSGPATLREVLDLAEVILQSPLDISRPLWTATLVEGMADGRAAMLLHVSHAVTDGVGGVEMFAQIYDLERDPPPRSTPPQPIPEDLSPNDLMRRGINHLPIAVVGGVLDALSGAVSMAGRAVLEPVSTVSGILGYARSGIRVLNRAAEPSPLLRRRSLTTRTEAIDIRLADLHKAAKAGGGSINDAYLAGLCGALRRYHEALGVPISTLPMAVPVNLRAGFASSPQSGEDRSIVPVRVIWLPPADRSRAGKVAALLPGRDPYHPSQRQQRRILRTDPRRARVVAGESAKVSELRQQWRDTTVAEHKRDFAQFVSRRALLALARAEYRILGPQYKSPRLVKPEMLASARFRAGLDRIPGATVEDAGKMLDELSTGWSQVSVDLVSVLGRLASRGFDPEFDYDEYQVAAMRAALEAHPAVLLFSHRSYIDGVVVPVAMQDNRLPPVHMFGGINLSFGLMGPLMRRSGMIFIRRNIGNDPLYKYVLKEYVGYVVEKRFNLSWSIEGTRSRTGKMLPPKLGLMSYVADAYLDGRSDDILLQGVSICFDQLHEITEYAAYARGAEKTPEGLRWLYNFIKAQGERNFGKIYVRFPEAVSMRQYLGAPHGELTQDPAAKRLALQKMSFEVAWRILQATPVTATGLVSALLLTTRGTALTLDQLHHTLQDSLDYLERKQSPVSTSALRLRSREGVRAAADALSNGHPVTRVDSGREPVWYIAPDDEHAAAFYRNSVIHAFLETSIVELALAHAKHAEGDRVAAFWAQAMRLRDLLKFDFYFADSTAFRANIAQEMAWHQDWEDHLGVGGNEIDAMLYAKRPLMSDAMLRVFFEAYEIVADVLRDAPPDIGPEELTELALGLGRQFVAQGRVRSSEPVSTLLFATARQVAVDQELIAPAADLAERRVAFRRELRNILRDFDYVEQIARNQFVAREFKARQGRDRI